LLKKKSPFVRIIYTKKPSTIENISNKKGFTKFTRYGASWEKKTVIINYKARDTILEEAVNLLMRDSRLNKEVTKGKKLSWREIMEIF